MMSAGSPPDLVLDLTNGGLESEAVKSLTRDLGLPTLTTSMGGLGDIREWAGLSEQQSHYLVQVRGPHDLYLHVIRDLATSTRITNVPFHNNSPELSTVWWNETDPRCLAS